MTPTASVVLLMKKMIKHSTKYIIMKKSIFIFLLILSVIKISSIANAGVVDTNVSEVIETRILSPWGAVVKVRHENTMRLGMVLYSKPFSQDNRWHVWPSCTIPFRENSSLPQWLEILTDSPIQKEAVEKGLSYDPGLISMQYDPLELFYQYEKGSIKVNIHNAPVVTFQADDLNMQLRFNKSDFTKEKDLFYKIGITPNGTGIYYGVIVPDGKLEDTVFCKKFAVIWGDTKQELMRTANKVRNWNSLFADTKKWIEKNLIPLQIEGDKTLANEVEMQKRMFTGTQFKHGGIFAALDSWYERIWVRDGSAATIFPALAGYPNTLIKWAPYLLNNPVSLEHAGGNYSTFITCPIGYPMNKHEQDGPFYATLSSYAFWKLFDNDSFLEEWFATLSSAIDYIRAKDFSKKYNLYSETYINEAPFKNALGWETEKLEKMKIDGKWVTRMYTYYLNNLMYSTHLMMGEMALQLGKTDDAKAHFDMANSLVKAIEKHLWNEKANMYYAGIGVLEDGTEKPVDWYYYNIVIDSAWAEALYPTTSNPEKSLRQLDNILKLSEDKEKPLALYFSPVWMHLATFYAAAGQYEKTKSAVDLVIEEVPATGYNDMMKARYAMAGAMVEIIKCAPYHHRPQTFAAGPFMQSALSLGIIIDYNGISLTPTNIYKKITDVHFRDAVVDIDLADFDKAVGIIVDSNKIYGTLKVPEKLLAPGKHKISFLKDDKIKKMPVLQYTHLKVVDVKNTEKYVEYKLHGYGVSAIRFNDVVKKDDVEIMEGRCRDRRMPVPQRPNSGEKLPFLFWKAPGGSRIQLDVHGEIIIRIKKKM